MRSGGKVKGIFFSKKFMRTLMVPSASRYGSLSYISFFSSSFFSFSFNCCFNFITFPFTWIRKVRTGTTRNKACIELIFFLIQAYAMYWILCAIHTETYVFQSTQVSSILRPVRRSRCDLTPHTLSEFNGDGKKKKHSSSILVSSNLRPLNQVNQGDRNNSKNSIDAKNVPGSSNVSENVAGSSDNYSNRNNHPYITSNKSGKKLSIALVYLYDGSKTGGNGNDGGESWSEPLMQRVIQNRMEYCRRHGYRMVNANLMVDKSRPAAWSKLKAMDQILSLKGDEKGDHILSPMGVEGSTDENYINKVNSTNNADNENNVNSSNSSSNNSNIGNNSNSGRPITHSRSSSGERTYGHTYDYLLYIDMDVVIMDLDRRLEDFLDAATTDFIMTEDWKGPNTGTWFVQNARDPQSPSSSSSSSSASSVSSPSISSPSTLSSTVSSSPSSPSLSSTPPPISSFPHWFLRTAWAQTHLIQKKSPSGLNHPFEYEQRAFHFMLDTTVWRDRGLQRFRGQFSVEDVRRHFLFFPQCSFNSYSLHPLDFRGDREISQYVPGDFVIHFAGKKGRKKVLLMEHYLSISEKNYKNKKQ